MDYNDKYKVKVPEGEQGSWRVEHFEVPSNSWQAFKYGARAPNPGTYTRLIHVNGFGPVMSDTSAEVRDHWEVIAKLKSAKPDSRVLVHGLGIGMVLQVALRNENIQHVDVVELEQDVIDLVAPHYLERTESGRLTVHHGDAFTFKFPVGTRWSIAWHDIWPTMCTDDLAEHAKLNRRYAKAADWQGCWAHELLLDIRRRGG